MRAQKNQIRVAIAGEFGDDGYGFAIEYGCLNIESGSAEAFRHGLHFSFDFLFDHISRIQPQKRFVPKGLQVRRSPIRVGEHDPGPPRPTEQIDERVDRAIRVGR